MSNSKSPSEWQKAITGEWHGIPSIFEPDGTHVGFNKVSRASVFEEGKTTYRMNTAFDCVGSLRNRFEMGDEDFSFGVIDSDADRVYCGPDFCGAGRPFGMLVDSHYFSPGWNADLRTVNLILPERNLQVYSSQLFEGNTLIAVFNGIYLQTQDNEPETEEQVRQFLAEEKSKAKKPFVLPVKSRGCWFGKLDIYDNEQNYIDKATVEIHYEPLDLTSAKTRVKIGAPINREFETVRKRTGNTHQFEGPDVYGNGRAYGRYLWTTQHLYGEAFKIRTRDTQLENNDLAVVWQFYQSDKEQYTAYGLLTWEKTGSTLEAKYLG